MGSTKPSMDMCGVSTHSTRVSTPFKVSGGNPGFDRVFGYLGFSILSIRRSELLQGYTLGFIRGLSLFLRLASKHLISAGSTFSPNCES
ncbi:hypothetical protein H5410_027068 [Solanum commersonii]|uniref:Uncharacterized protein n=1 Tax=Solanum commersonii TaxID=4109 RepID=A0A9J5Z0Q6_SOLCO|nr:hypothetical protein H5410_027068 [Solanum commersonii]